MQRDQQFREARRETVQGKMAFERPGAGRLKSVHHLTIGRAIRQRFRQRFGIFLLREEPVHSVPQPFAHAADIRADHGLAEPHRFQDRDRHRFIARWENQHVGFVQKPESIGMIERIDQFHFGKFGDGASEQASAAAEPAASRGRP